MILSHARQKSASGIRVSASALGRDESRRSFGEDLAKYGIQPIWLEIENGTDDQLVYLQIATDSEYYSPDESLRDSTGAFSSATNRTRDAYFIRRKIRACFCLIRGPQALSMEKRMLA